MHWSNLGHITGATLVFGVLISEVFLYICIASLMASTYFAGKESEGNY